MNYMKLMKLLRVAILVVGLAPLSLVPFAVVAQTTTPAPVVAVADAPTPDVIASSPEAVVAADQDKSATIEYGNMVSYAAHTLREPLLTLIMAILAWAATYVPGLAGVATRMYLSKMGEHLVQNALDWGVNAVDGATKDKKLDVNVGSAVLAEGIEYALKRGWPKLVDYLGGAAGIGEKMFRKMDVTPEVTKQGTLAPAVAKAINSYPYKH